ncbi:unnamed protein product [Echinostoma caproni]|uniref:Clathrin light chain n=1 Tax=Echinostoma caproni TaxID=27848 RepID=A0A183AMM6_9TREM|nr:unnamed protein product [Echinostoma caproni]
MKEQLNDNSLNGSLSSFDTGLGGGGSHGALGIGPGPGGLSGAFGDLDWSSSSVPRGLGASSVPLPALATSTGGGRDRMQPVSAMGMPISNDPFFSTDPFATTADTAAQKATFPAGTAEKDVYECNAVDVFDFFSVLIKCNITVRNLIARKFATNQKRVYNV